ncbi:reverse transcriptase domain-containing protein [Streptomyces sp. NPDC093984]|uniref:reverse transcriptase domain-containing protein n=1 Tax=Streptomyces sp. NPDC093984 TaxID=3366052 RepID=UPI0038029CA2
MGGSVAWARATTTKAAAGRPNWRIVRYADDFVVLTDGKRDDVEALREDTADVLQPLGLRLSEAKTQVMHMPDGFDFLGTRARSHLRPGHPHDAENCPGQETYTHLSASRGTIDGRSGTDGA